MEPRSGAGGVRGGHAAIRELALYHYKCIVG
ncbi:hypothetical protein T03_45 [Trichinella britovi]|uniref:Uncharacterized protein n=1 Tax=Trichinella britovi TaxID=45882 RepID=A0A0V0YXL9_TRIBR|nr:hypothetical protein T03_45 [Trichinella britovi]